MHNPSSARQTPPQRKLTSKRGWRRHFFFDFTVVVVVIRNKRALYPREKAEVCKRRSLMAGGEGSEQGVKKQQ